MKRRREEAMPNSLYIIYAHLLRPSKSNSRTPLLTLQNSLKSEGIPVATWCTHQADSSHMSTESLHRHPHQTSALRGICTLASA